MVLVLSLINALVFTIISGFHFYWAMGGKVGFDVVLLSNTEGAKSLNPSKSITCIAACVFLSVAIFYLYFSALGFVQMILLLASLAKEGKVVHFSAFPKNEPHLLLFCKRSAQ